MESASTLRSHARTCRVAHLGQDIERAVPLGNAKGCIVRAAADERSKDFTAYRLKLGAKAGVGAVGTK